MSAVVVIDASVALKWVVAEAGSDEASDLLNAMAAGALSLVAPDHLVGEVGNGLRKRIAQGVLDRNDALTALGAVESLGMEFFGGPDRWFRTLRAALDLGVTTYDALYILLAVDLDAELITADARLVESARRASLPVRPLTS